MVPRPGSLDMLDLTALLSVCGCNIYSATAEDPDPNGIAAWAAWASVASAPQDGADQWQVWQAAAAAAGYDIGPEAAVPFDDEPEAPPGMSDVEDDSALPLRREPKVPFHANQP